MQVLDWLQLTHTTSWMVVRKSSKAERLWVELTPQDRCLVAVDGNLLGLQYYVLSHCDVVGSLARQPPEAAGS